MTSRILLLLAVLAHLSAASVHAQSRTTAALRGTVVQEGGQPVEDALVSLAHQGTGAVKQALTDEQGRFMMLQLQPGGPYSLTVEAFGFEEHSVTGIVLQVGDVFPVEVTLRIEAIEVEGVTVGVDAATTEIFDAMQVGPATRIDERTIDALPILSRDVMEVTVLSPLVRTTESGGFSVAGQNDRYNAILVDGILSQDMFGLTSGGLPGGQAGAKLIPIDAVSQFEILVAPYDVRLSGFTGGVMNAVTRTGTNEWVGRVSGVHRNEALIGDLSLPTGPVDASTVDRSLVAFSLGGPLVRDRLHVFTAAELERRRQPPDGFNLFRDDPSLVRISEDRIDELASLMESGFGIDAGEAGPYPLEQELANAFTRFDWNLEGGDRMTLRHILAHAANDEQPNRRFFEPYELSSNAVFRSSTSHIAALQYFKDLGDRLANEVKLTFQRTVDRTTPASDLPQIEVGLLSSIDEVGFERYARMGGQFFAHRNDLEQTSLRLTNSLDVTVGGDDVLTLGVAGAWFGFRNAFLPGSRGEYLFPSLDDLERNAPFRFQRTVLAEGEPDAVEFDVAEVGAFVQRQINAGKGLTMHFGLRADIPFVFGRPERNIDLEARYGYDTSQLPSGNVLISPRWGFNWQTGGERNTQVRGGAGMFSGHIPYVWLANAFHQNGLRSVIQLCEGRRYLEPQPIWAAPAWVPGEVPTSCDRPTESIAPFVTRRNAVVFEPGFRYPQDIRFSVVVDRELTDRITGSVGVLFNTAVNQVGVENRNLVPGEPQSEEMTALGGLERRYYDQVDDEYQHILVVTNEGQNVATSGTVELRGSLTDRIGFQFGYSFARTRDRTSLVHTDMMSNFGSTPAEGDVNRPSLATSNFDRPHKIVAAIFGAPIPALPETEISLFYNGQSGLPFSYVYWGDINGDGFPGVGGAFDRTNDLIHVPRQLSEAPMSLVTMGLLSAAIERDACLAGNVGSTLNRNECRTPWEHRLDLRVTHALDIGGTSVRLEADMLNVLSLLDPEWGRVQRTSPLVPLLELCRVACEAGGPLPATWGGGVLPRRTEEGRLVPSDPWTVVTPESQWRMQVGARVSLGGWR